jgi:hypothetical protein
VICAGGIEANIVFLIYISHLLRRLLRHTDVGSPMPRHSFGRVAFHKEFNAEVLGFFRTLMRSRQINPNSSTSTLLHSFDRPSGG